MPLACYFGCRTEDGGFDAEQFRNKARGDSDRNTCPTGVATQDPRRIRALNVDAKHVRVRNFQAASVSSFIDLAGAMGLAHPHELRPEHIFHRVKAGSGLPYSQIYPYLSRCELLGDDIHPAYAADWRRASAAAF